MDLFLRLAVSHLLTLIGIQKTIVHNNSFANPFMDFPIKQVKKEI